MRKYVVKITADAIKDIEELAEFYFDLVGEESAERFSADVIDTIKHLDTFPESNSYFDKEHGLRRAQVRNHKVNIVYIVDNGVYEVVAFGAYHSSSNPSTYSQNLIKRLNEITA